MLKHRVITAAILIPLVLFILFSVEARTFSICVGVLMLAAAVEWASLMGLSTLAGRFLYLVLFAVLMVSLAEYIPIPVSVILSTSVAWWFFAAVLVLLYPRAKSLWCHKWVKGVMGVLVLIPCWVALSEMRAAENGIYILLFVFALIWGADTTAYFVGKRFGKHKLLPGVSPGKTLQGVIGALVYTMVVATIAVYFTESNPPFAVALSIVMLAVITVIFSIIGDLFESMLKRDIGIKDSGQILPGHGGLLDRIDSLTAAAPIYVFGMMVLSIIFTT